MPNWAVVCGLIVLALIALWSLGRGVYLGVEAVWFRWSAAPAVGEVVRVDSRWVDYQSESGGPAQVLLHYPVIGYTDGRGRRHQVEANYGSRRRTHRPGDRVAILPGVHRAGPCLAW